jgi:hypothetical protein
MRISRDSAIWKSAYATLCQASEPHGEDLQDIADAYYGGDIDTAEAASDLDPYCSSCDSALEMCHCADEMEPGPEMRQLLEMFAKEVYQKGLEDLKYEELAALRDMLVEKQDKTPVHEI